MADDVSSRTANSATQRNATRRDDARTKSESVARVRPPRDMRHVAIVYARICDSGTSQRAVEKVRDG